MARNRRHHFDPLDRGLAHIHRWTAHCACGWYGRHHRRRKFAKDEWLAHRNGRVAARRQATEHTGPQPKPLTPVEQLPEELRCPG